MTCASASPPLNAHDSQPIVHLEGAGVRFGSQYALNGITLDIFRGERLAIIGPNGAGKTTLLRLLLGLESHCEGQVKWSGPMPRIGYVPQKLAFDPHFPLTVGEFLAVSHPDTRFWMGGIPRALRESLRSALERTNCASLEKQLLGTLSGGELQRVLIAAALLQQPELLILDEPSANIDHTGADQLRALLADLHEAQQLTMVFVSHDLHFVFQLANRVACLNGSLCGVGPPGEILDSHLLGQVFGRPFTPLPILSPASRPA